MGKINRVQLSLDISAIGRIGKDVISRWCRKWGRQAENTVIMAKLVFSCCDSDWVSVLLPCHREKCPDILKDCALKQLVMQSIRRKWPRSWFRSRTHKQVWDVDVVFQLGTVTMRTLSPAFMSVESFPSCPKLSHLFSDKRTSDSSKMLGNYLKPC